jgi:hypothetical protein
LLLVAALRVPAQTPRYVIAFTDKHGTPYRLDAPAAYLSNRALQRRARQHIAIDSTDLPLNPAYIDSVLQAGNVQLLYTLRWFNQAVIQTSDSLALQKIQSLPFVKTLEKAANRIAANTAGRMQQGIVVTAPARTTGATGLDYGSAYTQIHLHEGEYLHNKNFRGDGMLIAILDNGFPSVDNNRAFAWLRDHQKITATYNFTSGNTDVYNYGDHGTHCFSILAANLSGEITGTAPEAAYVLLRTEEESAEQPIEETNWIGGVTLADSLGVDVISSSLGYNTFDNPAYDHTYAQLDGHSLLISQAATLAARKGMIVVNSAGNEGTLSWKYLLAPADADSILTVGAVNRQGQVPAFSSYGPAADGRIKPDVAGLGVGTTLVNTDGAITNGNGTSYACPVLAGLVTCLWQAFPRRTNMEILQAVKAAGSQYTTPDNRMGYGIPNFHAAYDTLLKMEMQDTAYIREQLGNRTIKVFPNPFSTQLNVYYQSATQEPIHLQLIDAAGRITKTWLQTAYGAYSYFTWQTGLEQLPTGIYYLRMVQGKEQRVVKLLKQ